ncbi:MAG: ribose-phosphate diphosphokinase [Candidatus Roizmanbacteria bacterium]|nr:ribose-phosphate diphosphokinase [Candidatus Roizmanbacteria bacterium]
MQSMTYFAGSASSKVAEAVVSRHGGVMGKSELSRFSNSEIKVRILTEVADTACIIIQSLSNPTSERVLELAFYLDALRREQADSVDVIIPYLGYARQNIQHLPGECVSAHVIISLIESLGARSVTTIDIHDEATAGVFTVPFTNVSALPLLAQTMKKTIAVENTLVGSPDQGGVERSRRFAEAFYEGGTAPDLIVIEKKRNLEGIHDSQAVELYGDVTGKNIILVDDVATSGGTMLHAAQLCLDKGARQVYAAVVHADFGEGVMEKIANAKLFEGWYTTNTIEEPSEKLATYPVFHQIGIDSLL